MGQLTIFRYVSQKPSLYAYADVSSWWSKSWPCLYLHPYFVCASSGEALKMRRLIGFVETNSHVLTDKLYKHTSSIFGPVDDI